MNQRSVLVIVFILAIVIIAGIVFLFTQKSSPADSTTPVNNPFGSAVNTSSSNNNTGNTNTSSLSVTLKNGSTVTVPDFTKQNQPSTANAESGYQVAGSNTADYQILYFPQNSGFLVSLFVEPLGSTRLEAEAALRKQLGLTDSQLCALTIEVRTTMDVNQTYGGRDLGLSFCPGAVPLP